MRLPWLLLPLLLAACQAAPARLPATAGAAAYVAPPAGKPIALAVGGRLVGKSKIPEGLVTASKGALLLKGAAIISNGGAPLSGPVAAPLVPTGGGSLVAPYGLLAEGQKVLAGFPVRLLDVAGSPALDAAGKPYETVTTADGTYEFATTPVGQNLIVALDLPGGLGRVIGFLPAPAGAGTRNVDLEGVGTHVLGYLLDQQIKGDAARFARLVPADEAGARADAEAALAAAAKGRLDADSLATNKLVATVGVWRGLSQPFDRRLKAIARTLDGLPPLTPPPRAVPSGTPSASAAPSAVPSP